MDFVTALCDSQFRAAGNYWWRWWYYAAQHKCVRNTVHCAR